MAAALRLNTIAMAATGEFGRQVIDFLETCHPGERAVRHADFTSAFDAQPDMVTFALWRADAGLAGRAEHAAHENGIPWLPVVLDHLTIRIGPLVVPGSGPCFTCFDARLVQHDRHWESTAALRAGYEGDRALGPRGFLPQHARTAAGWAAGMLAQSAAGSLPPGHVVTLALPSLDVSRDQVVAVGSCRRCRETPAPRDMTTLLRLSEPEGSHV
ncbi:TOMM precursor leader peptide-binding protein [Streptomyces sp. MAR4 CNX-425]|uniref:TOMM precursor leader peptide-binding protein n=1 Tax=Streptomyces sp. MAR4 CNX-425 TaxID=3406343 RepID=UPI003B5109F1